MFLVSPEAHIRNLLQGARTARKFGPKMPIGYIPDPFGHPGQTPQILRGFGLDVASLWRGVGGDKPAEMWWESPDGSEILLANLRDGYGNGANLPVADPELFAEGVAVVGNSLVAHSAVDDHLIMLGTDHMAPSPFTSQAIAYADKHLPDTAVVHSTLPEYIRAIKGQISDGAIPTIHGELRACDHSHLLPGVLSTRMWIKQRNHYSQVLLEKWAEPFGVFAEYFLENRGEMIKWSEQSSQEITSERLRNVAPIIRQAWRLLMENHPHDSICGCSIDQVHAEMESRFDQVDQIGEEITKQALHTLAEAMDTQKEGVCSSIVLFNPHCFESKGLVEVELALPKEVKAFEIIDEHGQVLPHEVIGVGKFRIAAPAVPAIGWRTFWLREISSPETGPLTEVSPLLKPLLPLAMKFAQSDVGRKIIGRLGERTESEPPDVIENEFFNVEADKQDGTITVYDKQTGTLYPGLNRFVDGSDAGDEYNYAPLSQDEFFSPKVVSIKAYPNQLAPSLKISSTLKIPLELSPDLKSRSKEMVSMSTVSIVSLPPGLPRIDVKTEIENQAKDHRLRVHFPAPLIVDSAAHDGHFEVVKRKVGVPKSDRSWVEEPRPEVPQLAFTDVSDGEIGLMIANRGLPEVEVIDVKEKGETEIALTLIRCIGVLSRDGMSVRQGHAGPALETPGAQVPGKGVYEYAIIPHKGAWQQAYQHAYAFETSLQAIQTDLHHGEISDHGSFIAHAPMEFVISSVKESEDGKGWLVRGYNISSETIQVNLKPLRKFSHARQINLAEEEIHALVMDDDGSVDLSVLGYQIVSVKFLMNT
jgi:alpha-mannosidase